MINIINHGTKYNITICSKCHCQFSYEESDLTEYSDTFITKSEYNPKTDTYTKFKEKMRITTHIFKINCPDCNFKLSVKAYAEKEPLKKENLR